MLQQAEPGSRPQCPKGHITLLIRTTSEAKLDMTPEEAVNRGNSDGRFCLLAVEEIADSDKDPIIRHTVTEFHGNGISDAEISDFTRLYTDWTLSRKLVLNGALIGFYLLREGSIADLLHARYYHCTPLEDLSVYANRRGVEGIILLVLPNYRGNGYGNLLKNLPRSMGFDYIYGEQFKATPEVLRHWLKRRRLIADCDGRYGDVWMTLEDF